ncbi:gluconolactonase [Microlunatus endophyticus]|uniref:Gluconolactonase n=1 Tax=Microlunatus endophyticus TaxID=1716077 RepID=A0A917W7W2_9ACTN|nr:SMP-30/gluconolactonase/LRE family protein [Microlunatus endophyticus]GGL74090.1 gluconolactonase [Microlunatus endophyticus]
MPTTSDLEPTDTIKTEWERLDERFTIGGDRTVQRLFTGGAWLEGPQWFAAGRYLVFSDIPNNRILRWDETTNQVGVFRNASGYTNGHTIDNQGRLVSCEHGGRRVSRTEFDGSVITLADNLGGKRLNSPNDVVVARDGSIYFSDPAYGIDTDYEGFAAESEIGACHLFRISPDGELSIAADDFDRPNGLAFTPDESQLLVVDSERGHIRSFDYADGKLSGGDVVIENSGGADGIRFDNQGRLWTATHEGLRIYTPELEPIGKLHLPEIASNLSFGGAKLNQVFITATTSLYTLRVNATGAR